MTKAQKAALKWFAEHGGDGLRIRGSVLAGGERASVMYLTWGRLIRLGLIERYGPRMKRMRLTALGREVAEMERADG